MEVKIIAKTENPIETMWVTARTCYSEAGPITLFANIESEYEQLGKNFKDKKWQLIKTILSSGHLSIAEHVNFTFAIEGISRACSHQLVRHRHCTFSQQSQRYVEIKEDLDKLVKLRNSDLIVKDAIYLMEICKKYFTEIDIDNYIMYLDILIQYLQNIKQGMKPEDARAILPNATKTNIVMTCNLRELMHMSNLRLCTRAQKEIRQLFEMIQKRVTAEDSKLGNLLIPKCEVNGFCTENKSCGRKPMLVRK